MLFQGLRSIDLSSMNSETESNKKNVKWYVYFQKRHLPWKKVKFINVVKICVIKNIKKLICDDFFKYTNQVHLLWHY